MKSDLIDIEAFILHQTDEAILIADDLADGADTYWLPKSKIEIGETNRKKITEITLPEWLAKEKGLI